MLLRNPKLAVRVKHEILIIIKTDFGCQTEDQRGGCHRCVWSEDKSFASTIGEEASGPKFEQREAWETWKETNRLPIFCGKAPGRESRMRPHLKW